MSINSLPRFPNSFHDSEIAKPQVWLPGCLLPLEDFARIQLKQVTDSLKQTLEKIFFFIHDEKLLKATIQKFKPFHFGARAPS